MQQPSAYPVPTSQPGPSSVYVVSRPTSSAAVVSLVFGLLGWTILPVLGSLIAVITGHSARAECRRGWGGDGMAVAGLILGWLQIGPLLALVIVGVPGLLIWFATSAR